VRSRTRPGQEPERRHTDDLCGCPRVGPATSSVRPPAAGPSGRTSSHPALPHRMPHSGACRLVAPADVVLFGARRHHIPGRASANAGRLLARPPQGGGGQSDYPPPDRAYVRDPVFTARHTTPAGSGSRSRRRRWSAT
jgi:hypothetical protein